MLMSPVSSLSTPSCPSSLFTIFIACMMGLIRVTERLKNDPGLLWDLDGSYKDLEVESMFYGSQQPHFIRLL